MNLPVEVSNKNMEIKPNEPAFISDLSVPQSITPNGEIQMNLHQPFFLFITKHGQQSNLNHFLIMKGL